MPKTTAAAPKKKKAAATTAASKPRAKTPGAAAAAAAKKKPIAAGKKPAIKIAKKAADKAKASKPKAIIRKASPKKQVVKPKKAPPVKKTVVTKKVAAPKKKAATVSLPKGCFVVDRIKAERVEGRKRYFLIKWEGYPESANTWEPEDNILDSTLIEAFKEEAAPAPEGRPHEVAWQYYLDKPMDGKNPGWHNYAPDASLIVEDAFQDWQRDPYTDVRSVKSGSFSYQVDFNGMTQTNITHSNHTVRTIRRVRSTSSDEE